MIMASKKVQDKIKKGLESSEWHSQPASFAQTSKLSKETGKLIKKPKLCTWVIELTKIEASDMIGRCIAGDRAEVRSELIGRGCGLWDTEKKVEIPIEPVATPKATTPKKSTKRTPAKPKQERKADEVDAKEAFESGKQAIIDAKVIAELQAQLEAYKQAEVA